MHLALSLKVFVLIAVANGAPLVAKRLLGAFFSYPVDAGMAWSDGRRLLGPSKTIRGLVAALVATTLCAPLLGIDARTGLLLGAAAMLGDLLSSFVKRRSGQATSSRAPGLDQVPESLLPALAGVWLLGLTLIDVILITALFTLGNMLGSRLLFRLLLRDRPY